MPMSLTSTSGGSRRNASMASEAEPAALTTASQCPETQNPRICGGFCVHGRGRIRTFEGISHQIYSLLREATQEAYQIVLAQMAFSPRSATYSALAAFAFFSAVLAAGESAVGTPR